VIEIAPPGPANSGKSHSGSLHGRAAARAHEWQQGIRGFLVFLAPALVAFGWAGDVVAAVSVFPGDGCPAREAIDTNLESLGALVLLTQLGTAEVRVQEPSLHVSFLDRRGGSLGVRVVKVTSDCGTRATLAAAVIAQKMDPKVYVASNVEQLLGFAPMAVLPDFDEVSEEVFSEHLLRLSATIEHARKQGSLKNCIFTGTAPGTGVTTVLKRVRDILEAMGRPTVLLDGNNEWTIRSGEWHPEWLTAALRRRLRDDMANWRLFLVRWCTSGIAVVATVALLPGRHDGREHAVGHAEDLAVRGCRGR